MTNGVKVGDDVLIVEVDKSRRAHQFFDWLVIE